MFGWLQAWLFINKRATRSYTNINTSEVDMDENTNKTNRTYNKSSALKNLDCREEILKSIQEKITNNNKIGNTRTTSITKH